MNTVPPRVHVGSLSALKGSGRLLATVGTHQVCVVWHDGGAFAVDDRCPHMGFPLHRGTVAQGQLTCHWHHARFHWFQAIEAAVSQTLAWPEGSTEGALILAGAARFLAAHTPTRRQRAQVVRIASRLRRGERFFEDASADA